MQKTSEITRKILSGIKRKIFGKFKGISKSSIDFKQSLIGLNRKEIEIEKKEKELNEILMKIVSEWKKIEINLVKYRKRLKLLKQKDIEIKNKEKKINRKIWTLKDKVFQQKKTLNSTVWYLEQEQNIVKNYYNDKMLEIEKKFKLMNNKLKEIKALKDEHKKALEILRKESANLEQKKTNFKIYTENKQMELSQQWEKLKSEKAKFEVAKKNWYNEESMKVNKTPSNRIIKNVVDAEFNIIKDEDFDFLIEPINKSQVQEENNKFIQKNQTQLQINKGTKVKSVKSLNTIKIKIPKKRMDNKEIKVDYNEIKLTPIGY